MSNEPICETCRRPEKTVVGIYSSPFAAMSRAICQDCVNANAEPLGDILFGIWSMTSGDGVDDQSLPPYYKQYTYFNKETGEYLGWESIKVAYPQWKESFDKDMDEMNNLNAEDCANDTEENFNDSDEFPF